MGPGKNQASEADIQCAYEIGKIVSATGAVLLCGGMTGVMESVAKAAQENGGLVVGVGPTMDKHDLNAYIDIPLMTGMHAGRNFINIASSDMLIFVGVGSPGTLSELAFAIQLEKPTIIIRASQKLKDFIEELKSPSVVFVATIIELEQKVKTFFSQINSSGN